MLVKPLHRALTALRLPTLFSASKNMSSDLSKPTVWHEVRT